MRILLLNQFFWPDAGATSQFLTDLARLLAEKDHSVTAICGRANYVGPDKSSVAPAVQIERLAEFHFGRSVLMRSVSAVSFLTAALWRSLQLEKPDIVVTLTTPPLLSIIGTLLKKFRGSRHFIWEMDVYPDVAVDLRFIGKQSLAARAVGFLADYSRRYADGVIALGECMRDRLLARGIPASQIHVAENWADGTEIVPIPFPSGIGLTLLYSGNLGLAHDVNTILGAIDTFKTDERFRFIFAGGGRCQNDFIDACGRFHASNVSFRQYCPRDELGSRLGEGDVGLVLQQNGCVGSVVPSKTYGLMAAGRPILLIGPRETTPARIIERFRCGWQIDCGDTAGLIALLEQLAERPQLMWEAGERGRQAFLEHYDLPIGVARITAILGLTKQSAEEPGKTVAAHGDWMKRGRASSG